jgi:hypothetical protein
MLDLQFGMCQTGVGLRVDGVVDLYLDRLAEGLAARLGLYLLADGVRASPDQFRTNCRTRSARRVAIGHRFCLPYVGLNGIFFGLSARSPPYIHTARVTPGATSAEVPSPRLQAPRAAHQTAQVKAVCCFLRSRKNAWL